MIIIMVAILSWIIYLFAPITPEGATRSALLVRGYFVEATTAKLERQLWTNDGKIVIFVTPPPHAEGTDTSLFQWNVKKYGIFYVSEFGVA